MKRARNRSKPRSPHNLILEEVIGLTTKNGNGLASSISSSKCAYIAGCVVVLYNVHSGTQSHLTSPNHTAKPLSCVALSPDASIIAAGESGHQPGVLVWDCATLHFKCELKCHSYGVACMALSPDGKQLVSAGFPRDGYICLWDLQNKILAAKVKASSVSSPITSVDFSLDKKIIVTADKNELKFWNVRWSCGSHTITRSVSLTMQRKVDLGHHKESSFLVVTSPRWKSTSSVKHIKAVEQIPFYAVTKEGTLCMVYLGSSVVNSVELEVEKCYALSTSKTLVACACNNGLVKLFSTNSLKYAGGLSYLEAKTCTESSFRDCDISQVESQSWPALPDAVACQFSTPEKLVVIYDDHSLYIWNIHDIHKATRCCVLVSHSRCIWDIKSVPCEYMHDPSLSCVAKGCSGGLSFVTCSADGNIRLWDLAFQSALSENSLSILRDDSSAGATCLASAGIFERDSVAKGISSPGFRSMAVSSDGKHLAAGDFQGNIHIFNLSTSDYIFIQEAHGAEILSLSFNLADKSYFASNETLESRPFLASGGRDGRIHLFDVERNFNLFGSIDCHSSDVTVVKLAQSGREILSCGADGSLVLHGVDVSDTECKTTCLHRIAINGIIDDVAIDNSINVAFTIGQDKKINAFDIRSGKLIRQFQNDGDIGNPIKVTIDGSCSYLACSYSNRSICIYDYKTGEMVAQATGHSDVITDIVFLPDSKHLVSVGADSCIFVWKLPAFLSSAILQRTKRVPKLQIGSTNQPLSSNQIKPELEVEHQNNGYCKEAVVNSNINELCGDVPSQDGGSTEIAGFRFSISQLPKWARYQVTNSSLSASIDSISSQVGVPESPCHESRSPSKNIPENGSRSLSETDSPVSTSPPRTFSWPSDHRWLTIHTVCMDPFDSPKTCDMNRLNVQGSTTENRHTAQRPTTYSNKRIRLSSLDPSSSCPPVEPNFVNYKDDDVSRKDSQDNVFFKMNFGNLSAEPKIERCKSSTRSSFRSRFIVRRELLEERKRSVCVHAQDSIVGSPRKTDSNFSPLKPSKSLLEAMTHERYVRQMLDHLVMHEWSLYERAITLLVQARHRIITATLTSSPQDAGNRSPTSVNITRNDSTEVPDCITATEMPNTEVTNIGFQESTDNVREVEAVRACEEALHNLEAAAENLLQSFTQLAILNDGVEKPKGFDVQYFCSKAATRIPSIEKKIQEIAKLLQPDSSIQLQK